MDTHDYRYEYMNHPIISLFDTQESSLVITSVISSQSHTNRFLVLGMVYPLMSATAGWNNLLILGTNDLRTALVELISR